MASPRSDADGRPVLRLESGGLTDRGRVRAHNEDSLVVEPESGLLAVCDGMGGHVGGEIASRIAAETVQGFIREREADPWPYGRDESLSEAADVLRNATLLANDRIARKIESEPWLERMGTTLVSALVAEDGQVHIANVGDSRGYLLRGGRLRQLTSDHSWVNEQVQQGVLTPSEAENHPLKNVITRALGARTPLGVDLLEESLEPGDALLLCSDGLTTMLKDDAIEAILRQVSEPGGDAESVCRQLIEAANGAGGEDNITVALVIARSA